MELIPQEDVGSAKGSNEVVPLHRLTVVSHVYHQTNGGDATDVHCTYNLALKIDEETYRRRQRLMPGVNPIDLGWCRDLGVELVHVENPDKTYEIRLGFGSIAPVIRIPPRGHIYFSPMEGVEAYLESDQVQHVNVMVVPK